MGKKEFNVEDLPDLSDPSEQVTTTLTENAQYIHRYNEPEEEKKDFWHNLFSKKEK